MWSCCCINILKYKLTESSESTHFIVSLTVLCLSTTMYINKYLNMHNNLCKCHFHLKSPRDLKKIISIYLSVYLSACLSVCLSVYLSIYLSVYLSVCLSVCLKFHMFQLTIFVHLSQQHFDYQSTKSNH
uniref:Uncharacterized protein n=1 Tax=Cyprinus carpio TaxID=7962 RepID=A0A8C1LR79_CYPCA